MHQLLSWKHQAGWPPGRLATRAALTPDDADNIIDVETGLQMVAESKVLNPGIVMDKQGSFLLLHQRKAMVVNLGQAGLIGISEQGANARIERQPAQRLAPSGKIAKTPALCSVWPKQSHGA